MTTNAPLVSGTPRPTIRHRRFRWSRLIKHVVLIAVGLIMIYPLLWMVSSSLKPNNTIFKDPGLIPSHIVWSNWIQGWTALTPSFGHYMLNSLIVALGAIVGNVLTCSMAAYGFARLDFWGRGIFFAIMLMTIMLPIHVLIVPQYVLYLKFGWIGTFLPLIVPKFLATDAFFVFLMVQFFRGIPRDLDEAARIDGCGHVGIFTRIMLPLSLPAIATTVIFTFIWSWNDFFGQLIFLPTPNLYTVTLALRAFVDNTGQSSYGELFAMSTASLIPVFVIFLFGQKYLVRGIATTGIK